MSLKHSGYPFLLRAVIALAAVFILLFSFAAAESTDVFAASAMRLLRYEGTVEIFGADGEPRTLPDDACFASGESLRTGENSKAWISLDEGRNLVLDADTHVVFIQEGDDMRLILRQGLLLLDVQKKLAENEKLEIELPDMTVHIRGTLVFAQSVPDGIISLENNKMRAITLAVLEGTAEISCQDTPGLLEGPAELVATVKDLEEAVKEADQILNKGIAGGEAKKRVVSVSAGEKVVLSSSEQEAGNSDPVLSPITSPDIAGFVAETVAENPALKDRVINGSENGAALLNGALPDDAEENEPYPADGDWFFSESVTIVAQSASKLYDGKPLSRPSDVLVSGLPGEFSISVTCNGSRTDAGTSENTVYSYAICNASGENVTSHFTSIQTVPGSLRVDPAPITVWTGSAEKEYDGTPLTCNEAGIRIVHGYISEEPSSQYTSTMTPSTPGSKLNIGNSGSSGSSGSTVGKSGSTSEETSCTPVVLDPTITVTATGSRTEIGESFNTYELKWGNANPNNYTVTEELGTLTVTEKDAAVTTITAPSATKTYDGKPLTVSARNVTATGLPAGYTVQATVSGASRTQAGSNNTKITEFKILNSAGKDVSGEFSQVILKQGRLTVKPAPLTITGGSAQKVCDGKPLTCPDYTVNGLIGNETVSVTTNGTITNPGVADNPVIVTWGSAKKDNYELSERAGTLTVLSPAITLKASDAEKVYDGTPLTSWDVTVSGLPEGFRVQTTFSGSRTDAGTGTNAISAYSISDAFGEDVTSLFTNVSLVDGTLTVDPAPLTISSDSAEKTYDGTPLTKNAFTVTGLVNGETVTAAATGSQKDAGTSENAFTVTWGTAKEANYSLTKEYGTLTVKPAPLTASSASAEKTYDGTALTNDTVTFKGLADGETVTPAVSGSQKDAGTSENAFTVAWDTAKEANYTLAKEYGTLTVKPAPLTASSASAEKTYDGTALTNDTVKFDGLADGETVTPAVSGSQKDAGSSENAFTVTWGTAKEANYTLTKEYGTLTVKPAPLTASSASAEKTYDGTALTNDTVTFKGLADGETVTPAVSGSQKDAGSSENAFTVTWGTVKEANYTLTKEYGTLTVKPAPLTASSASAEKTYDGTALTNDTVTFKGLADGETVTPAVSGTQTDAGESENAFTLSWGTAKEANYTLTKEYGTLTVKPAPLTITSASDEKAYDGTPLTNNTVTFTGLVNGETVTAAATGSQTDAGESENAFTVAWGTAKESNYAVTDNPGTLKVNKAALVFNCGGGTYEYGNVPHMFDVSATLNGNPLMGGVVSETPTGNTYSFSLIGNDSATLTIPYFNMDSEPSDDPYPLNQTSTVSSDNYAVSYTNTTVKITPSLQ